VASIVNSKVSKQWFWDKYAVNAPRVHGGDAVLLKTSGNVGRRGQYGPVGIERLSGLEGKSPDDMNPSSSASQSERTDEQRGDISFMTGLTMYRDGGFRCFERLIALRRYFMGTECVGSFLFQQTESPQHAHTLQLPMLRGKCLDSDSFRNYTIIERYLVECIGQIAVITGTKKSCNCFCG
jgi:hypothetical protein